MKQFKPGQLFTIGKRIYKCTKMKPLNKSWQPTRCMTCVYENKSEEGCPLLVHEIKKELIMKPIIWCFIRFKHDCYPFRIK